MLCYKNEAQGATTAAPEAPSAVPEAAQQELQELQELRLKALPQQSLTFGK